MTNKNYNPIQLKGGFSTEDPRLGRIPHFDVRSRGYGVSAVLGTTNLRTKTWPLTLRLNQISTSACVGFSRIHDLAASPRPLKRSDKSPFRFDDAFKLYELAQTLDEWPGEDYAGSSLLGGLKAAQQLGYIGEYRWAFNIDQMLAALSWIGPVVVGTIWYNTMFDPFMPKAIMEVDPRSGEAGGHAYMFRGITVTESGKINIVGKTHNRPGIPLLRLTNSWWKPGDPMWGRNGEAFMWADDYERYLMPDGEQSIVTTAFHR